MKLTKKMHEVLMTADLEQGEVSNVPMSTMYGFESRKLVPDEWRKAMSKANCTTAGGRFPQFNRVKLTTAGIHAARAIQGLSPDL